jgi:hypothetical protein
MIMVWVDWGCGRMLEACFACGVVCWLDVLLKAALVQLALSDATLL